MTSPPRHDLLLVGGPPYFGAVTSVQQPMARAWARLGGRVLYLEHGGDKTSYREKLRAAKCEPVEAEKNLHVLRLETFPGMPWAYPDAVRRLHLRARFPLVERALEKVGFVSGKFAALYYGWYWAEWLSKIPAAVHACDCIDEHRAYLHIEGNERFQKYIWQHEQRMLAAADLLVATSPALLEDRERKCRRSVLLPNAIDPELFSLREAGEPCDIAALPRPRAILVGNLGRKFDFEAIDALARERPGMGVVLAGPPEKGVALPRRSAQLVKVGGKPQAELPAYLAHADVGLIPLAENAFNRGSCPLKMLEYLAAGLPVTASRIPATAERAARFPDFVHLADSASDFPQAVDAALRAGKKFSRAEIRASVSSDTWEARVAALRAEIAKCGGRAP